ncbi:MAG TPA: DUF4234 domain-containing protein [Conexibacter sp.]|nr:DUF4234 domain-containing protein [Conexibacter sp.]
MAQEVHLGDDATGKIRDFWDGFLLAAITLGLYELWWYYRLNDELRTVGRLRNDRELSRSRPAVSTATVGLAVLVCLRGADSTAAAAVGMALMIAGLISQYRFGQRLRRAQELVGLVQEARFEPLSFLLLFPGYLLVIPPFFWYAGVTRHQNAVVRAAAVLSASGRATFAAPSGI